MSNLPIRPKRKLRRLITGPSGGHNKSFAYHKGISFGANNLGYNNPYKPGLNHDEFIHGYLDAVETAKKIQQNKNKSCK